ncbi:MAG TPA: fucose isomerase [Anaerolineae bacterium]|nr:fucose isomerase [Anaerolineae bacterium]HPL28167.1 fucose isomerase [Anaerolineae bacterium]
MTAPHVTLGVIVGSRRFFPAHLCAEARATMLQVLEAEGMRAVALSTEDTPGGAIECLEHAQRCAALFRAHREEIDGIVVTLPNFGDERAVANALHLAGLNVPVLVHAFPDVADRMTPAERRDSFCGKISVCNNLRQYGIPFSLTQQHTVHPAQEGFRADLRRFAAVCRVVRGLRGARFGVLGARPAAFNTVRYSEKLLQRQGITVETLDLSEAFGRSAALADADPRVQAKGAEIRAYADASRLPPAALLRLAKVGVVIDEWIGTNGYAGTAVQCWTSMQEHYGVFPCALMSMLSERMLPCACEADIAGAVAMHALNLASGRPGALVDWNNNYGDDPDRALVFHCSNLPRSLFVDGAATIERHTGTAASYGEEQSWGMVHGRIVAQPFTYLRITTDDLTGKMLAYVGEGELTADRVATFGGYGVVRIPNLQGLLRYICTRGFEHHVAISPAPVADAVYEALTTYLGWEVYHHDSYMLPG